MLTNCFRNAEPAEAGAAIKRDIPMGRFGKDGDLDGALLLLASDAGAYITGATRVVDGGTGLLHGPGCPVEDAYTEYFLPGTEPTKECPRRTNIMGKP